MAGDTDGFGDDLALGRICLGLGFFSRVRHETGGKKDCHCRCTDHFRTPSARFWALWPERKLQTCYSILVLRRLGGSSEFFMPLFQQAVFLTTVANLRDMPQDSVREVAFAGRSNAGKSSAINTLAGRVGWPTSARRRAGPSI
jgi:hypothetical protein